MMDTRIRYKDEWKRCLHGEQKTLFKKKLRLLLGSRSHGKNLSFGFLT